MIAFERYILRLLDIVHALEYRQAMAHTRYAHALQIIVMQRNQGLPHNLILDEPIAVLLQAYAAYEVRALVGRPLCDDGLGQSVRAAAAAVAVRRRRVLCRRSMARRGDF